MNIVIFGSCVSRDVFRVANQESNLDYYARSSLISIVSNPLSIALDDIKLESEFQKKMVFMDFQKTFLMDIKVKKDSFIVLDFIDERFDLMKVNGSYVTRSNEFVNGNLERLYTFERIPRFQNKTHKIWEESCQLFMDVLLSSVPAENIIIHEAYWSEDYIENGHVIAFPNKGNIEANNEALRRYYNFVITEFPQISIVSSERMGSSEHKWGLSPVHYTDDYYNNIYKQIKEYIENS